jgi:hypothetical protein
MVWLRIWSSFKAWFGAKCIGYIVNPDPVSRTITLGSQDCSKATKRTLAHIAVNDATISNFLIFIQEFLHLGKHKFIVLSVGSSTSWT